VNTTLSEPTDLFYGDRNAGVQDTSGNTRWIATRIENVSPEELKRCAAEEMKKRPASAQGSWAGYRRIRATTCNPTGQRLKPH